MTNRPIGLHYMKQPKNAWHVHCTEAILLKAKTLKPGDNEIYLHIHCLWPSIKLIVACSSLRSHSPFTSSSCLITTNQNNMKMHKYVDWERFRCSLLQGKMTRRRRLPAVCTTGAVWVTVSIVRSDNGKRRELTELL